LNLNSYENYGDYIDHQSKKTLNPEKREKWLNQEWNLKIDGFKKEFKKIEQWLLHDIEKKCLCIGARTGQEVVALKELGLKNTIGIDIIPCLPHVIEGDMHDLKYEDNSIDFVFTNILDHSLMPDKFISEIERVLKPGGVCYIQMQIGIDQDEYTEFQIQNPFYDVISLFNMSYCNIFSPIERNFAGMNFEIILIKDDKLQMLYEKYGNISNIEVPKEYEKIWEDINLKIQEKKLDNASIFSLKEREAILNSLKKRAYYLTRIAEVYDCKTIAEVGTAEGWQFYTFGKFCIDNESKVFSCDPRDVRSEHYAKEYNEYCDYTKGTSKEMSEKLNNVDMFYIDGLHDTGTVLNDVKNLENNQNELPVWIFDDFDTRFGCYNDIANLAVASKRFKIWKVGKTASGQPSHQVLTQARYQINN
jgi:SAM-dependent methyltransferase